MHVIGEVAGCSLRGMSGGMFSSLLSSSSPLFSFGGRNENAFAGWEVKRGKEWKCVGGREMGQTQVDYPEVRKTSMTRIRTRNAATAGRLLPASQPDSHTHPVRLPLSPASFVCSPLLRILVLRMATRACGIIRWTFTSTPRHWPAGRSSSSRSARSTSTVGNICVRNKKQKDSEVKRMRQRRGLGLSDCATAHWSRPVRCVCVPLPLRVQSATASATFRARPACTISRLTFGSPLALRSMS